MRRTKIFPSASELRRHLDSSQSNPKTVLCLGVFDVLHPGHIAHLAEAKTYGDVLVVSVAADEDVKKGPGRPLFIQQQRMNQIAALEDVDYVIPTSRFTSEETILRLKPEIFVRGPDYIADENPEMMALRKVGGKLQLTSAPTDSSTRVSSAAFRTFSSEVEAWLDMIRTRISAPDVEELFCKAAELNVLVIAETTEDVYHDAQVAGSLPGELHQSVKILGSTKYPSLTELFAGHLSGVAAEVRTISSKNSVKGQVYIESGSRRNLFATQEVPQPFLQEGEENSLYSAIESQLAWADVVIAVDYGHGLFTSGIRHLLETKAKFLAVTVKTYHGNTGFNLASKFQRFDYLALNSFEYSLVEKVVDALPPETKILTTNEANGLTFSALGVHVHAPSLVKDFVDSCGAGDAAFSYTAPLVALGAKPEIVALVAAIAASIQCEVPGNTKRVQKGEVIKTIQRLLSIHCATS